MNHEQPPITFSDLLRDRERLAKENARLKRRCSNQRKELKRLARVERALRDHYRSTHTVSPQERAAESALLREDLKAVKLRLWHAEDAIARAKEHTELKVEITSEVDKLDTPAKQFAAALVDTVNEIRENGSAAE